jgi:hypothetical protein
VRGRERARVNQPPDNLQLPELWKCSMQQASKQYTKILFRKYHGKGHLGNECLDRMIILNVS